MKMAKRGAEKELTQDNWDQEDEEEEVIAIHFTAFLFVLPFISTPRGGYVYVLTRNSCKCEFV